jgi:predicted transcriptional regulator
MPPTVATSLKLSAELKAAIDEDARKQGLSSHAYMVKTLADAAERARRQAQFTQDATDALADMEASGLGYDWGDVKTYLQVRSTDPTTARPVLKPIR